MKTCRKCRQEKDISEFNKDKSKKNGYKNICKNCTKLVSIQYYLNNKEKLDNNNKLYYSNNKEKINKIHNSYYSNNKTNILKQNKTYNIINKLKISEYRIKNRHKFLEANKKYYHNNKKIILKKEKERRKVRYKTNICFKIEVLLRNRINMALKNNIKSNRTLILIGCSINKLKEHLQQTAINNGYTNFDIKNYSGKEYHIDHIVPVSKFNLKCSYHQKLCFNYINLQILTKEKNLKKGDKYDCK